MQDAMRQGDGVGVGLQCGHPNVQPGKVCPLCGSETPQADNKEEKNSGTKD